MDFIAFCCMMYVLVTVVVPFLYKCLYLLFPPFRIHRSPNGQYWIARKSPVFPDFPESFYSTIDYINDYSYDSKREAIAEIKSFVKKIKESE